MSSKTYWEKREAEALKHYLQEEQEYQAQLRAIYQNMLDAAQKEIDAFYGRYADKEQITLAEAKRRVSKLDIAAYQRKAKRYVADKDFGKQANEEMRLYNLTMKVNRLEMLKANIGLELVAGHDEQEQFMAKILRGRTEEELQRQAGILGKTVRNNAKLAETIPNASFHNATFSERIWGNQTALKAELSKQLQVGMIQGKNPRVLAKEIQKTFGTSTSNAERLMRTELARVQTEAQRQSFLANDFEEYTFHANRGCCSACADLDGKHFKIKDMMPGKNAPPMHPNCRCSVSAYEDDTEYEAWLDFLDKGGTTEEWNRRKDLLEKGSEHGIMKVNTGGLRNETPLTTQQIKENVDIAVLLGMPREQIRYGEHYSTAYGSGFDMLYIGTDVYPNDNGKTANQRVSNRGALSHEIVGHRETVKRGTAKDDVVLDEAQASIRAARFSPILSNQERYILIRDAIERLRKSGIKLREVRHMLDIKER